MFLHLWAIREMWGIFFAFTAFSNVSLLWNFYVVVVLKYKGTEQSEQWYFKLFSDVLSLKYQGSATSGCPRQ